MFHNLCKGLREVIRQGTANKRLLRWPYPFAGAVLPQNKLIPATGAIEIDLRILRLDGEEK